MINDRVYECREAGEGDHDWEDVGGWRVWDHSDAARAFAKRRELGSHTYQEMDVEVRMKDVERQMGVADGVVQTFRVSVEWEPRYYAWQI